MEKVTPEKIRQGLRAYLNTLYGDQLCNLVRIIKSAETMLQLPASLKDALALRKYFLTRNLLETVRQELLELIPWRCLNGKLVSPEHSKWIECRLDQNNNNLDVNRVICFQYTIDDIPSIIQEYSQYLQTLVKKQGGKHNTEISVKLYTNKYGDFSYLLVEKAVMYLSKVKSEVEKWLSLFQSQVKDVHFVATDIFYVDCSLENVKWHGIDILVISQKVQCLPLDDHKRDHDRYYHRWDISGADGEQCEPERASNCKNGTTGNRGEHGGHLLFIASNFVSVKYLVVVSNGGNGGRGQHGGNGKDGVDGKNGAEWSIKKMNRIFPNPVGSDGLKNFIVESVFEIGGLVEFKHEPASAIDVQSGKVVGKVTDFYAKGQAGCVEYQVGFQRGIFQRAAFCLVNGSPGFQGTSGGQGYFGGQGGLGGRKGSVTLLLKEGTKIKQQQQDVCLPVVLMDGRVGRRGLDGENGKHGQTGRDGKDIGYMAWGGKESLEFPPGKYELKMRNIEDSSGSETWRMLKTVNFNLLGKSVAIGPKAVRTLQIQKTNSILTKISWLNEQSSRNLELVNETWKRIEKYKLMQRHGRYISRTEIGEDKNCQPKSDFDWWIKKILDI